MATAVVLRRNPRLNHLLLRPFSTITQSPSHPQKPPDSIALLKTSIRSESDPERIASLFLSAPPSATSFHGDRRIYSLAVRRLAASRRNDLIESLLNKSLSLFRTPSEGFLIRILTLYSQSGMLDQAVRTFDLIETVTDRSFSALLSAFCDNKRFEHVRNGFKSLPAERNFSPGIASYNVLLKSLCSEGDMSTARLMLDEMPSKGVDPDIVSYNEVLNGYLKKNDEASFDELLKLITRKNLKPNSRTYNCRIALLCNKGRSFEAVELLDVMESKGVYPNHFSFDILIEGFVKEGEVGSAMGVFRRMKEMEKPEGSNISLSNGIYIMLIKSLVEKGVFEPAAEVCSDYLGNNKAIPFKAVKGIIIGLINSSEKDKARDLVKGMRKVVNGNAKDVWKNVEAEFSL